MSEPDEVRFGCIGCGTFNPARAEVCAGCGRRFEGLDVVSPVRIALPPRNLSENPYEAPRAAIAPPRTFQIGSMLEWIAVIGLCMGAFRSNLLFGIVAILTIVPPSIRTSIVAWHRRAEGRPFSFDDRASTFAVTCLATWAIVFATSIAFSATCLASTMATKNVGVGLFIGVCVAVYCVVWLSTVFLKGSQEQARRDGEIRYR